jgi:hypothetical protein
MGEAAGVRVKQVDGAPGRDFDPMGFQNGKTGGDSVMAHNHSPNSVFLRKQNSARDVQKTAF